MSAPVVTAPDTASTMHRCLRGRRCANAETTANGAQLGAQVEAAEGLCSSCERKAEAAVRDLPRLYIDLELIIGEHASAGEHVSGTRELPTPVRLDVLALQADIDATVTAWAPPVARRCRIPWDIRKMTRTRPGPRVVRAAHVLASNMDAFLCLPAIAVRTWAPGVGALDTRRKGIEGALDLMALHQRGRYLVSGGSGNAHLPVPCPQCEAPALVRGNGRDQVDCRSCGAAWPESDYRRLCMILADDYRARRSP